ncbi:prephenate dehydrogenase [Helcobacillus massiliensis]|uniref:prephenate dehydrogenase n=1 Tax=Helcobacillus massiliensis TaxID=521392 RepID=UPI0021A2A11E|nr:prephenate dehydrogenase [Helcobacillus massiliensis]MCT1557021.1 prephenate dehydrogenase [Helcobacillus massiliensis]MCT2035410.1 prephenate dehydrogenase [Helcobacillus massiliensis]MCT2331375.1 prephenate dehydrogenase [Helcobacillus massiliensis]
MTVLVIGAGLIGGSVGLALRARGREVLVRDSSPGTARLARELGVGADEGESTPGLVVVATPPDVTGRIVVDALREFPDAIVCDVASVKETIQRAVLDAAAADPDLDASRYVGAHPMAGREVSGVVAARGDLFLGRPFVLVPHDGSSRRAVDAVERLGHELGGVIVRSEAAAHDLSVAYVSHAPQLVASLLARQLQSAADGSLALAGQGLRDTTRIAHSDPRLWVEILAANAPALRPILRAFQEDLGRLVGAFDSLCDADGPGTPRAEIARTIADGNLGVARIPGKHGGSADSFAAFTILVPDSPGALARLLSDMGDAGINMEDLRLEHSIGQPVGLAHISVLKRDEGRMVAMLEEKGWARAGEE